MIGVSETTDSYGYGIEGIVGLKAEVNDVVSYPDLVQYESTRRCCGRCSYKSGIETPTKDAIYAIDKHHGLDPAAHRVSLLYVSGGGKNHRRRGSSHHPAAPRRLLYPYDPRHRRASRHAFRTQKTPLP